jgi:hypothetical protein
METKVSKSEYSAIEKFLADLQPEIESRRLLVEKGVRFGNFQADIAITTPNELIIIETKIGIRGELSPSSTVQEVISLAKWIETSQLINKSYVVFLTNQELSDIQKEALFSANVRVLELDHIDQLVSQLRQTPEEAIVEPEYIGSYIPPKYALLSDTPIASINKDLLGFSALSQAIAKQIVEGPGNFTIGILGDWGSGKSSIMKMVQENLETWSTSDRPLRTIWFNPWLYQSEPSPVVALVRVLRQAALSNKWMSPSKFRNLDLFNAVGSLAGKLMLGLSTSGLMKTAVEGSIEIIKKGLANSEEIKSAESIGDQLQQYFSETVNTIVGANGKLIIFIDDLDRCVPELVISVLELPQLYLQSPNCVLVFGLDPNVIEKAVDMRYGFEKDYRRGYLEKIIQLQLNVPPLSSEAVMQYIHFLTQGELASYEELITKSMERSPRQIKRLLNYFVFRMEALKSQHLELDPGLILKLTIIQMRWPRVLNAARFYPNLLISKFENVDTLRNELSKFEIEPQDSFELWSALSIEPNFATKEIVEYYLDAISTA